MARIAVAGFQHETNTYASTTAGLADFEVADAWPPLVTGEAMSRALAGANLPAAGFLEAARSLGHRPVPLLWCSATPSGPVEDEAFESISGRMLAALEAASPRPEAVYLDLHGAMVTVSCADGDGEILRRVRARVGAGTPVVASLDFHANVSDRMLACADALVAYRTYPHVDMALTGERAMRVLDGLLRGRRLQGAARRGGYLVPLTAQYTGDPPMSEIMDAVSALEGRGVEVISVTAGFPLADVAECGPCVFAWDREPERARAAVTAVAERLEAAEGRFRMPLLEVSDAVRQARALSAGGRGPVILADTQDNPGAGGNADTVHVLRALVAQQARGAAVGVLFDPSAAAKAHAAGVGGRIAIGLGAGSAFAGEQPLSGLYRVEALGDGRFDATGPFYAGARMQLGPMARLSLEGVQIVVASRRQQAADRAMFHHVGLDPATVPILALKSSVHFRADFGPMAAAILLVRAPGPNIAQLSELDYRNLRPGVRIGPGGEPVAGK